MEAKNKIQKEAEKYQQQKRGGVGNIENNKMGDLNPTISVIALNISRSNISIKRQSLTK